jgi:uncharacterized membrane protein (UPF0127 family)
LSRLRWLIVAAFLMPLTVAAQDSLDDAFDRDVLVIAARNACFRFDIYLALSREQQRRGLMFVRELPMTTGMLFVYPGEAHHSMWMKNTFIPLDILFARSDGTVSSIAKDTTPQSLKSISSTEPVTYVLELNAGVTDTLLIEPGSLLIWEPGLPASEN